MNAAQAMDEALIALAEGGQRPACSANPDAWHADTLSERVIAARLCAGCPLIGPCADLADELRARWGVWGGVDRTRATATVKHAGQQREFEKNEIFADAERAGVYVAVSADGGCGSPPQVRVEAAGGACG